MSSDGRRDRTGEIPVVHPDDCDGWIDRDADHPIPCWTCRPHLARRPEPTHRHVLNPKPRPEETA